MTSEKQKQKQKYQSVCPLDKQSETPLYNQPKRLNSNGICGTSKGTQRPNIVLRFLPN